jgi:hypothetical protein
MIICKTQYLASSVIAIKADALAAAAEVPVKYPKPSPNAVDIWKIV